MNTEEPRSSVPTDGKHARLELLGPADHASAGDLEQLQTAWLELIGEAGRAAATTVRCYETDLRQFRDFLAERGHSTNVADVEPSDVAAFRDSNLDWKPSTVKRKLAALARFFDWALEHGLVQSNPVAPIGRPESHAEETRFVTPEDALAMLLQCRDDRERAIFMTFWRAGLRYQELQHLKVEDVDLSRNEIRVEGKGGHIARVPILSDLRPYLVRWMEARPGVGHDYFFTTRTGRPMYNKCARRLLTRLIKHAGLEHKGYTPHSLRHGCATVLYEAGVYLGTVAQFLRHRDMSTVGRYVHASTGRIRREIEDKLGSQDADALTALNTAQTESLIERIAERVALKLRG